MGGSVFSTGTQPLVTPRMPKAVYLAIKRRCHVALRQHYLCVASPIDGPGKIDFGDVDVLVTWPKKHDKSTKEEVLSEIRKALQAPYMVANKGKDISAHFALPWPSLEETLPKDQGERGDSNSHYLSANTSDEGTPKELFAQVDVRLCETFDDFQWMLFKHAHGDIWNLLGTTIRPFGLSVDEKALYLRVPEIEYANRNRAKIFLTSDPVEILQFLDLPILGYWSEPFEDLDAMYEYVAQCRMFWVKEPEDEEAKALKSNDRARMNKRPGFRKWVEEFKPRCYAQGRFLATSTTREQVTEEAFACFHVEEEFNARRHEYLVDKDRDMVWTKLIKGGIPDAESSDPRSITYRSCLVKALKRVILEGDAQYGTFPVQDLLDGEGFFVPERVTDFISRHRDEIGRVAINKNHAGYVEHMERKKANVAAA